MISSHAPDLSEVRSHGRRVLWMVWFAASFVLGAIGYWQYEVEHEGHARILSCMYHSLQLFALHMPHLGGRINAALEAGRWMAGLWSGFTALGVGLKLFARELQWWRSRKVGGHLVVCGLGRPTLTMLRSLHGKPPREGTERGQPILVLDPDPPEERVREAESLGARVIRANPTQAGALEEARAAHAARFVALTPDDSANIRAGLLVERLVAKENPARHAPLQCHLQLADVDLRAACQKMQPSWETGTGCRMHFTDVFDIAARRLLLEGMPLDRAAGVRADDPRAVQLVIVGFGRMGRSLALRAAKMGHFANGRKLRIAVIDLHARANEQRLLFRFPAFREVCDLEFHQMAAESADARALVGELCDPGRFITSIALCMEDEVRTTEIAFQFHDIVDDHGVPLAVRYADEDGLAALLCGAEGPCGMRVRPFGLAGVDWSKDVLGGERDRWLASVIHEDFRAARLAEGRAETEDALKPWDRLSESFRESNRQQADHIPVKVRAVGCEVVAMSDPRPAVEFGDEEVGVLAPVEHARWNAERLLDGWRHSPGPKDEKRKTHPSLVAWLDLPDDIKEYDRQAVRKIPYLLQKIARKAVRQQESR